MQMIDLTLELRDGSLSYPGTTPGVAVKRIDLGFPGSTLSGFTRFDPHCGTHFDAPLHFVPNGTDVATTPLCFPEMVLIVSHAHSIPADVLDGRCCLEGKAVVFSTGWERHAGTRAFFEGFPALSVQLAERLVAAKVALVGIDSPSVDAAISDYPAHRTLLEAGIPILEGLVGLGQIDAELQSGRRARLAAFPLRIRGVEGSPIRAVALVDAT